MYADALKPDEYLTSFGACSLAIVEKDSVAPRELKGTETQ